MKVKRTYTNTTKYIGNSFVNVQVFYEGFIVHILVNQIRDTELQELSHSAT